MDCSLHDSLSATISRIVPRLAQTHIHGAYDAIQPSHPLWSPSSPAFNLSLHQSLLQWVSSSRQVAKVLEFQLKHHSFQWILRVDFLKDDWFDLLAVQRTLKSLLQHHNWKASILWHNSLAWNMFTVLCIYLFIFYQITKDTQTLTVEYVIKKIQKNPKKAVEPI